MEKSQKQVDRIVIPIHLEGEELLGAPISEREYIRQHFGDSPEFVQLSAATIPPEPTDVVREPRPASQ